MLSEGVARTGCSEKWKTWRRVAVVNGGAGQVSVTGKVSRASVERRNERDFEPLNLFLNNTQTYLTHVHIFPWCPVVILVDFGGWCSWWMVQLMERFSQVTVD